MANNFGVIKATFTNYLNESENVHAKDMFGKFITLIKEDAVLRAQFEIYKNFESKYIVNENLALKYIDENINLLGSFKRNDIENSLERLSPLLEGLTVKVSDTKKELYEHIQTLLIESKGGPDTNVNNLHESFCFVLEYLKNNKPKLSENRVLDAELNKVPKDFLLKNAIKKFNERYSSLSESDKLIFNSVRANNPKDKELAFSTIKEETITLLSTLNEGINPDEVKSSINEIKKMSFNEGTFLDDMISLRDLQHSIK